jgi:hypothetical protein
VTLHRTGGIADCRCTGIDLMMDKYILKPNQNKKVCLTSKQDVTFLLDHCVWHTIHSMDEPNSRIWKICKSSRAQSIS